MTYMKALATAEDGFYPLGASGIWHGGIHFGQKTAESLKQDEGVHAIATGEVVAYRLDKKYPELNYQDKRRALYSTGFVLVRHTLTLPPAPKKQDPAPTPSNGTPASPASTSPNGASAPAGASGANGTPPASAAPTPAPAPAPSSPPPDETLTFFSLYMHTLDWESYRAALDQAKAPGADPKAPKLTGTRFMHTKTDPWYGPQHSGKISLGNCPALATMRAKGTLGEVEEKILRAMAQNEGCVDTVQAIDIAIISAGAMQKIIRGSASKGELAVQIATFRDTQPDAYQQYFANCGWTVNGSGDSSELGYAHPTFTNGVRLIGDDLYRALRRDCSKDTMGKVIKCPPVASMAHAVSSPLYQELQIKDFVDRLNQAINKSPSGYPYRIKDYLQSPLGRATALDQDVNYPGATAGSMQASLDRFFKNHPQASRNPAEWGANRATYETSILQDYGPTRSMAVVNGVSVAGTRYQHLVSALGLPS
ncbi:hypothetical protein BTK96_001305 [Burkholderia pyrrocinia]|nr:hypothetical protein [Burkholderia pyrrocinia]EKS9894257.1 hypothetical protein [Burkholderia pyrrocinia]EKS9906269.1 hypothetical protein [Burkholderia pyrrocinia]